MMGGTVMWSVVVTVRGVSFDDEGSLASVFPFVCVRVCEILFVIDCCDCWTAVVVVVAS